jgi:hypothetical protein
MRISPVILAAAAVLGSASCAFAGQFSSTTRVYGPNGNTITRQGSTSYGGNSSAGYMNHSETYAGPNGNSVSRDASTSYGNGQVNRSVTYSGPNGGTAGVDTTGSYSR